MKDYQVLLDDGAEIVISAKSADDAVQEAIERGYKAFQAVEAE